MATAHGSYVLVAAFDFGTTYSGYAYSFRDEPSFVRSNKAWVDDTSNMTTMKVPTCVLLTPDHQFHAFGYEAENVYSKLARENKHEGWLLFRRFKMMLHNNQTLTRQTTITDINGVTMPAITVFTMAIKYLLEQLLKSIDFSGGFFTEADIQYVLTVPAIWDERSRLFMREAAAEAGLEDSRLKLCKEPDAAAIYCQCAKTLFPSPDDPLKETPYMVLDLGGGTADIYVHEKNMDNTIKELYRASGGPWGGTLVDSAYIDFLVQLFGENTMEKYKLEHMVDYFDLLREFESKKRTFVPDMKSPIKFPMPQLLKVWAENIDATEKASNQKLCCKVICNEDSLEIDPSIVKEWFAVPINNVISHVLEILDKPELGHVQNILLVGGFAESKLVQEELKARIGRTIIIPEEPGLTVLKGAVRYGQLPEIVTSRSVIVRSDSNQ